MKRTEQITATLLSLTTVAISMLLVTYGVAIVFGEKTPLWTQIFAMTAIASGALIIAAGAWAWFGGGREATKMAKMVSVAFFVLYVGVSMDVGMISGLEMIAVLGIGMLLWGSWFGVYYVANRRAHT
ncbi:MAG: hypothetical protein BWZ07_00126 [Alphaproteobacteria bacterium ADurb.BinA280]|jgi:hypothetical protein|nr:hypothetical protein [Xanthomonadales bacterium]OPZ14020.1 MAG: hypothetical protein BWZ07_00126 [Alphaproteobacteria bacterium ADurb.BinA280]